MHIPTMIMWPLNMVISSMTRILNSIGYERLYFEFLFFIIFVSSMVLYFKFISFLKLDFLAKMYYNLLYFVITEEILESLMLFIKPMFVMNLFWLMSMVVTGSWTYDFMMLNYLVWILLFFTIMYIDFLSKTLEANPSTVVNVIDIIYFVVSWTCIAMKCLLFIMSFSWGIIWAITTFFDLYHILYIYIVVPIMTVTLLLVILFF